MLVNGKEEGSLSWIKMICIVVLKDHKIHDLYEGCLLWCDVNEIAGSTDK